MPRVPEYEPGSVRLNPVTSARSRAASGYAEAGQELGRGLGNVAQALAQAAQGAADRQDRADEAFVMQQDTALSDKLRTTLRGDGGILTLNGEQAVSSHREAIQAVENVSREIENTGESPQQKRMLARVVAARRTQALDQVSTHVERQMDVWRTTAEDARTVTLSRDAVEAPDEQSRNVMLMALAEHTRATYDRRGLGAEAGKAAYDAQRSNVYAAVVSSYLTDPRNADMAVEKFEQVSQWLLPEARTKLGAAVIEGRDRLHDAEMAMSYNQMLAGGESPPAATGPDGKPVPPPPPGEPINLTPPIPGMESHVTSSFGRRKDPINGTVRFHSGLDIAVAEGTKVQAAAAGVAHVHRNAGGYGLQVRVDHGNGVTTTYNHLSEASVQDGANVRQGQQIALSGSSGRSTGPHLHYEVWVDGHKIDPAKATSVSGTGEVVASRDSNGRFSERAMNDYAMAYSGGDPFRYKAAMTEMRAASAASQANQTAREQDAWNAVQPYLAARPDGFTSPAQIPQDTWRRLSPQQQAAATKTADNNADAVRAGTDRVTDRATEGVLRDMMDFAPEAFKKVQLGQYAAKLSGPDLTWFEQQQRDAIRGVGHFKPDAAGGSLNERISRAITLTAPNWLKKDALTDYKRAVNDAAHAAQEANPNIPLDDDAVRGIAGRLLMPTGAERAGAAVPLYRFGVVVDKSGKRTARNAGLIPEDERKAIIAQYRARHGRAPTEGVLVDTWRNARAAAGGR